MATFTHILVFERGPRAGRRIPFTPPWMTLGRTSSCDIAISDPLLSRAHCRFELRDGNLWLVDLESANETFVNDVPIRNHSLLIGDVVTAGDSVIRIERAEETSPAPIAPAADEPSAATSAPTPAEVVIDLGFDKPDDHAHPQKNLLRPLIWLVAAILILGTGIWAIQNASHSTADTVTRTAPLDNTLQLFYEKIEASAENIFRYELTLASDGTLAAKIDDLSGDGRHIEKKKEVAKELLAELARDIEGSGFFALDKTYTGFARNPNTLNESHLTIAVGRKVHTSRLMNRSDEPAGFRTAREKLETFSMNELGLWAIVYSAEKLTEFAEEAAEVARKRYLERAVKYSNLHDALRNYQSAIAYLDTVNPKPDFYADILEGFETTNKELTSRYEQQKFQATHASNTQDWPRAKRELQIICEMIPDRSDPRHTEALRALNDVEKRLRQR